MDPEALQIFNFLHRLLPFVAIIVAIVDWRLTVEHLAEDQERLSAVEFAGGCRSIPRRDRAKRCERIKLLTSENAQLRAELGSIKDRLETLERIATDQPSKLARDIEALTIDKGGNA